MDGEERPVAEPYWTERPRSRSAPAERRFLYRGELLTFVLDAGVFSARGLDPGTALLIENLRVGRKDRILDLGCGWGAVGVAAAKAAPQGKVVLTEVNRRAARLARDNVSRNHVSNAEVRVGGLFAPVAGETFDVIATNPPYRIGREPILELLREAPQYLAPGGRLVMVGKGSQGIRFYQEWLERNWPGTVEVLGRGSGYRVVEARRGSNEEALPTAAPSTRSGRSRVRGRSA
jgi:16S rRNA (guanine1207-N2)-methyltransferase